MKVFDDNGRLLVSTTASGGTQVYQDSFADPNGNVTPDDVNKAALYYPDGASSPMFAWDVDSQTWV